MAVILKGAPAAAKINKKTAADAARLTAAGVVPTVAVLRIGERADDISYEKSVAKKSAELGIGTKLETLPADVSPEVFFARLDGLCRDDSVHGILMLRPFPKGIDAVRACALIAPEKDIDGCSDRSLLTVFTGKGAGFPPCTAQAVIELLDYYGVPLEGKKVTVIGRSLVIGRPVAMLLMHRNATPTICHTKTENIREAAKGADILIAASGQIESIGKDFISPGQTVIDVGIGWSEKNRKLSGDVIFEEVSELAGMITPVPGGVGAVTTAVLLKHTAEAAKKLSGLQ